MVDEVPTTEEGPRMVRVPPEPEVDEWSGCDTMAGMDTATPLELGGSWPARYRYRIGKEIKKRVRNSWGLRVVVRWLGGKRGNGGPR